MIISIEAEKAFDKVQHPFMVKNKQTNKQTKKTLTNVGIEGTFLNGQLIFDKGGKNIK